MIVPLARLAEMVTVSTHVLQTGHVFNLRPVRLTTIGQDVNAHLGIREMVSLAVRKSARENVSMMSTVRIIEHVFNINVSTLAIY